MGRARGSPLPSHHRPRRGRIVNELSLRTRRGGSETFATQAATALSLALRNSALAQDTAQLEQALTSRTIIDQALGILMAQQHCTADDAFALLRAHSQNNNRKLHDVAADLITRISGQPPGPGHNFHRPQPTA